MNAQNVAVRALADVDVVAFSDANCQWEPDALRQLVAPLADPRVAYVCGRLQLRSPEGTNQEGAYWRYEIWLRARESLVHSVTGGNGSIYAVRRERYEEVDPRFGHDLSFPYLMVKRGFRAVYAPRAVALEKMTTDLSDEFRRKVRMFGHCWVLVLHGRMFGLRALGPLYWVEMISHRLLRYASGLLHLALLATSLVLAFSAGGVYAVVLALHVVFALCVLASIALRGRVRLLALPHYYLLVTLATLLALGDVGRGVPGGLGARGGHAVNAEAERVKRAIDIVGAAAGLAARRADPGARGLRDQARGRRPGAVPPDAAGARRDAVRGPQAAHDDRRRRAASAATAWSRRATRASRASARSCGARRSTSCRSSGTC